MEGRAEDLKEYALGVSALGRAPDYSPSADSCVRTRAYELRQKLRLFYELEAREVPVRIEIRKGGYAPQFIRVDDGSVKPPVTAPPAVERSRLPILRIAVAVTGGVLLVFFAMRIMLAHRIEAAPTDGLSSSEVSAFWKPFLDRSIPLVVSYDTRMFLLAEPPGLIVRDPLANQVGEVGSSAALEQMRSKMGLEGFTEVRDYADAGSLNAIFLLTQLFTARQRPMELKRSPALGWDDLWNSNVVFVGRPNLHPGMKYALASGDFVESQERIVNQRPKPGEAKEYMTNGFHGVGDKYALITELPGPQPGHHILILAGSGSEYGWALAEYVTNPAHVRELVAHLRGLSGDLPDAFQVLIQARFEANVPIQIKYVTHHVLSVNGNK